jgi:hypothetical protein
VSAARARACEVCKGLAFSELGEKNEHRFERCIRCGLERIEPQPTDETLDRIYGEHYYDAWGLRTDEGTVETLKRGTFTRIIRGLGPVRHGARVLDCGAATGFLMRVARDAGYEPYGAELSTSSSTCVIRSASCGARTPCSRLAGSSRSRRPGSARSRMPPWA